MCLLHVQLQPHKHGELSIEETQKNVILKAMPLILPKKERRSSRVIFQTRAKNMLPYYPTCYTRLELYFNLTLPMFSLYSSCVLIMFYKIGRKKTKAKRAILSTQPPKHL